MHVTPGKESKTAADKKDYWRTTDEAYRRAGCRFVERD